MTTPKDLPSELERIVVMGDSITDGLTYPHLLGQAFTQAGYQAPVIINAGIGGNRAADMNRRLDKDVLLREPTLVLLNAGVNDSNDVEPEDYESHIVSILDRLSAASIPVILLTPSLVRIEDEAKTPHARRLNAFRLILHRLAQERGLRVAEVAQAMQQSRAEGKSQWGSDGIHLDFEGYRAFVRAVLDSLGFPNVPVPTTMKLCPAAGLLRDWEIRPINANKIPANAEAVQEAATGKWQELKLPQSEINPDWYWDLVRQFGFATRINEFYAGKDFIARTSFQIKHPQTFYLTAIAENVWLRDPSGVVTSVEYADDLPRGWHPSPRARLEFAPGKYTLFLTCKTQFFVSLTTEDIL